ncbi:MAG TPA: RidA family protein [Geobacteraceae bacterium]|jgi:2-iminobutanoate/2-iminopropanoate deaminase|nr:RidA family protein [Geobacteraceae bacterium]
MSKEIIATDRAPKAIGPYSQAVKAGGFVFCSGQIPLDPVTGELRGADIREQTEQVMENIAQVLGAAGLAFDDVVKSTIFLTDLADFAAVNEVYGRRFPENPPARSTVEVKGLPRGARVEIEVIAQEKQF